jgi:hypothetical protein
MKREEICIQRGIVANNAVEAVAAAQLTTEQDKLVCITRLRR